MNSTAVKAIAAVLVAAAIILTLIAYQTSKQLSKPPPEIVVQTPAAETEPVTLGVLAAKPIRAYQPIKPEDVEVHPLAVVPPNYFKDPAEVVGRMPIADIDVGVPVTGRYFGNVSPLAQSIPPGHKAIALKIDEVIAVGSLVQPGDIVDVLLYVRGDINASNQTESQARVLLKSARVLAYDDHLMTAPVEQDATEAGPNGTTVQKPTVSQQPRRTQTVVVAVPDADTTRVMLGASLGELRMALHAAPKRGEAEDDGFVSNDGSTTAIANAERLAVYGQGPGKGDAQTITLRELTALKHGRETPRRATGIARAPKEPPAAIVHRGGSTEKVSRDGIVLK